MGKWVLSLILIIGFGMGLSLWWINTHRDEFRTAALNGLMNEFQGQKDKLLATLPADLQLNPSESWSLEFKGDELWISAPTLERKQPGTPLEIADFDRTRELLTQEIRAWLSKRPGDDKRFPIRLRFRNEPAPAEASAG